MRWDALRGITGEQESVGSLHTRNLSFLLIHLDLQAPQVPAHPNSAYRSALWLADSAIPAYLRGLVREHIELLLANPGFRLASIQVVLLCLVGIPQALQPASCRLPQCVPRALKMPQALLDVLAVNLCRLHQLLPSL